MGRLTKAEIEARKKTNMAAKKAYNQVRKEDAKAYRVSKQMKNLQQVKFIQSIVANANQKIDTNLD